MTNRAGIIVIIGLLCLNILSYYTWGKRYDALRADLTAMAQSSQEEVIGLQDRLDDLCARLSKVEKGLEVAAASATPFRIADDEG